MDIDCKDAIITDYKNGFYLYPEEGRERREQNFSSRLSKIYEPIRVTESDFSLLSLKRKYLTDQLSHLNLNSADRKSILNLLRDEYIAWRDEPVYLIFKEHLAYNTRYRAFRAPRRGNPVHRWRLKQRFKDLHKLFPDRDLTRSAHSYSRTNMLFVTLTYGDRKGMPVHILKRRFSQISTISSCLEW